MVIRLLGMLCLLFAAIPTVSAAAPVEFSASVISARVELGKPFDYRLRARDATLSDADLTPLERDFIIDRVYPVEQAAAGWESRRIRLYPRNSGPQTIPALSLGGIETAPLQLVVTPARDGDGADIRVSTTIESGTVWVHQAVRVVMQVENGNPDIWLTTEPPWAEGLEVVNLPPEQDEVLREGKRRIQHRVGWVLYPQSPGKKKIDLPPIGYRRDGIVTHRFYPPELELDIRPLPAFVPPTIPVGRMALEMALPDKLFFVPQELAFLTLDVKGDIPPDWVPGELFRQFQSGERVRFYAPRAAEAEAVGSDKRYRIPFVPKVAGRVELPPIRVQYFDPSTGKLVTKRVHAGSLIALPLWVVYSSVTALGFGVLMVLRTLYRRIRQARRRYRGYRAALCTLQQAQTAADLKTALMGIADAEAWPANLTLPAWQRLWAARFKHLPPLDNELHALQAWLYGRGEPAMDTLRPELVALCYRRVPLLRLLGGAPKWLANSAGAPFPRTSQR